MLVSQLLILIISGLTIGIKKIFIYIYYTWNMKTFLNKQLDRDRIELIRRYFTIHSFAGIAVHETWHGTSVGGGSLTSEREVRPIPFILVRSERILLNELIHCCIVCPTS